MGGYSVILGPYHPGRRRGPEHAYIFLGQSGRLNSAAPNRRTSYLSGRLDGKREPSGSNPIGHVECSILQGCCRTPSTKASHRPSGNQPSPLSPGARFDDVRFHHAGPRAQALQPFCVTRILEQIFYSPAGLALAETRTRFFAPIVRANVAAHGKGRGACCLRAPRTVSRTSRPRFENMSKEEKSWGSYGKRTGRTADQSGATSRSGFGRRAWACRAGRRTCAGAATARGARAGVSRLARCSTRRGT